MASIKHSGVAILRLPNGGLWKVFPTAVEFENTGGSERQMGPESIFEATYYIRENVSAPGARWSVSEYPVGALNHVSFEGLNGAELVSDFDFEMIHEPEQEQ